MMRPSPRIRLARKLQTEAALEVEEAVEGQEVGAVSEVVVAEEVAEVFKAIALLVWSDEEMMMVVHWDAMK